MEEQYRETIINMNARNEETFGREQRHVRELDPSQKTLDTTVEEAGYHGDDEQDESFCEKHVSEKIMTRQKRKRHHVHPAIDLTLTKVVRSRSFQSPRQQIFSSPEVLLREIPQLLSEYLEHSSTSQQIYSKKQSHINRDLPLHFPGMTLGGYLELEDTLSFTRLPRLLMQAEHPYQVVYANAAYAHRKASSNSCQKRDSPLPSNHDDFGTIVYSLFGGCQEALAVYPVVSNNVVSHYLVESREEDSSKSKNHISRQASERHAQAIG